MKADIPIKELDDKGKMRLAAQEELNAASTYEKIAQTTDNEDIKDTAQDIANEEMVHLGENLQRLYDIDPKSKELVEEGMEEAREGKEKIAKSEQPSPAEDVIHKSPYEAQTTLNVEKEEKKKEPTPYPIESRRIPYTTQTSLDQAYDMAKPENLTVDGMMDVWKDYLMQKAKRDAMLQAIYNHDGPYNMANRYEREMDYDYPSTLGEGGRAEYDKIAGRYKDPELQGIVVQGQDMPDFRPNLQAMKDATAFLYPYIKKLDGLRDNMQSMRDIRKSRARDWVIREWRKKEKEILNKRYFWLNLIDNLYNGMMVHRHKYFIPTYGALETDALDPGFYEDFSYVPEDRIKEIENTIAAKRARYAGRVPVVKSDSVRTIAARMRANRPLSLKKIYAAWMNIPKEMSEGNYTTNEGIIDNLRPKVYRIFAALNTAGLTEYTERDIDKLLENHYARMTEKLYAPSPQIHVDRNKAVVDMLKEYEEQLPVSLFDTSAYKFSPEQVQEWADIWGPEHLKTIRGRKVGVERDIKTLIRYMMYLNPHDTKNQTIVNNLLSDAISTYDASAITDTIQGMLKDNQMRLPEDTLDKAVSNVVSVAPANGSDVRPWAISGTVNKNTKADFEEYVKQLIINRPSQIKIQFNENTDETKALSEYIARHKRYAAVKADLINRYPSLSPTNLEGRQGLGGQINQTDVSQILHRPIDAATAAALGVGAGRRSAEDIKYDEDFAQDVGGRIYTKDGSIINEFDYRPESISPLIQGMRSNAGKEYGFPYQQALQLIFDAATDNVDWRKFGPEGSEIPLHTPEELEKHKFIDRTYDRDRETPLYSATGALDNIATFKECGINTYGDLKKFLTKWAYNWIELTGGGSEGRFDKVIGLEEIARDMGYTHFYDLAPAERRGKIERYVDSLGRMKLNNSDYALLVKIKLALESGNPAYVKLVGFGDPETSKFRYMSNSVGRIIDRYKDAQILPKDRTATEYVAHIQASPKFRALRGILSKTGVIGIADIFRVLSNDIKGDLGEIWFPELAGDRGAKLALSHDAEQISNLLKDYETMINTGQITAEDAVREHGKEYGVFDLDSYTKLIGSKAIDAVRRSIEADLEVSMVNAKSKLDLYTPGSDTFNDRRADVIKVKELYDKAEGIAKILAKYKKDISKGRLTPSDILTDEQMEDYDYLLEVYSAKYDEGDEDYDDPTRTVTRLWKIYFDLKETVNGDSTKPFISKKANERMRKRAEMEFKKARAIYLANKMANHKDKMTKEEDKEYNGLMDVLLRDATTEITRLNRGRQIDIGRNIASSTLDKIQDIHAIGLFDSLPVPFKIAVKDLEQNLKAVMRPKEFKQDFVNTDFTHSKQLDYGKDIVDMILKSGENFLSDFDVNDFPLNWADVWKYGPEGFDRKVETIGDARSQIERARASRPDLFEDNVVINDPEEKKFHDRIINKAKIVEWAEKQYADPSMIYRMTVWKNAHGGEVDKYQVPLIALQLYKDYATRERKGIISNDLKEMGDIYTPSAKDKVTRDVAGLEQKYYALKHTLWDKSQSQIDKETAELMNEDTSDPGQYRPDAPITYYDANGVEHKLTRNRITYKTYEIPASDKKSPPHIIRVPTLETEDVTMTNDSLVIEHSKDDARPTVFQVNDPDNIPHLQAIARQVQDEEQDILQDYCDDMNTALEALNEIVPRRHNKAMIQDLVSKINQQKEDFVSMIWTYPWAGEYRAKPRSKRPNAESETKNTVYVKPALERRRKANPFYSKNKMPEQDKYTVSPEKQAEIDAKLKETRHNGLRLTVSDKRDRTPIKEEPKVDEAIETPAETPEETPEVKKPEVKPEVAPKRKTVQMKFDVS